jgi:hypothetical protein
LSTRGERKAEKQAQRQATRDTYNAERQKLREDQERKRREDTFNASPPGQARLAKQDGLAFFITSIPLQQTQRTVMGAMTGDSTKTGQKIRSHEHRGVLADIEREGWRLEHAGWVFRETGMVSRDKLLSSGQTGSVTGEIVGIYLFRSIDPGEATT